MQGKECILEGKSIRCPFLVTSFFVTEYAQKKSCPACASVSVRKHGFVRLEVFIRTGWQKLRLRVFRCTACRHVWHGGDMIGRYHRKMVEYLTFLYLRTISFEQIRAIALAWFGEQVISKNVLIQHIEVVADSLPSSSAVTDWLRPKRSGYYALDGTYLKFRGKDFVLLILLDVVSLDVVSYHIGEAETEASYGTLLDAVQQEIVQGIKGFFCDGDPGLLKALKDRHPDVPIQLCVFHKYSRVGQIASFVRPKTNLDREIKVRVEKILFAPTKEEAIRFLGELEDFAKNYPDSKTKLRKIIHILKRNFDLLLTHYDNPDMSPYNNVLEGFNHIIKRRTRLMKGFKKPLNVHRWIKLLILDWRFHPMTSSAFKVRKNASPLELAGCLLPRRIPNWIFYIRENYNITVK